jgi:hypothetical protein
MRTQLENREMDEYQTWRAKVFPVGIDNDDLSDLAADLSMLDAAAADYLIPLVERGVRSSLRPELIDRIESLADRARQIAASNPSVAPTARGCQEYSELLVRVLQEYAP